MKNFQKYSVRLSIFILLLNIFLQVSFYKDYIWFLEKFVSPDNHVDKSLVVFIIIDLIFLFVIGILQKIHWIDWRDLNPLKLNLSEKFALSSILFIIVLFYFRNQNAFIDSLFYEDSFFQNLTVVCAFSTSLLFGIILIRTRFTFLKSVLILGMLTYFIFAMEEISWGQNIFKWNTSEKWERLNYQNETNIHNLFNPYFTAFYMCINFILFFGLFFSKTIKNKIERSSINKSIILYFPNQTYLYFAFIFFYLVFHAYFVYGGELTEILFSIFGVTYALNLKKQLQPSKNTHYNGRI